MDAARSLVSQQSAVSLPCVSLKIISRNTLSFEDSQYIKCNLPHSSRCSCGLEGRNVMWTFAAVVLTVSLEKLDLIQHTSATLLTTTPRFLHPVRKHQSIKEGYPGAQYFP